MIEKPKTKKDSSVDFFIRVGCDSAAQKIRSCRAKPFGNLLKLESDVTVKK